MAYTPGSFILGVVIERGALVKAIWIAGRDVVLIQLLSAIDDGFERPVYLREPSE
jgi:hypothetical protein